MKIKPLNSNVLLKLEGAESKTASGLIIPQTAQEKTQRGVVVAISDIIKDGLQVKVGDKVMYSKYEGVPVVVESEDHLIIDLADIIAIIED